MLVVCWNIKGQTGSGAQAEGEVLLLIDLCVIHPHHCAQLCVLLMFLLAGLKDIVPDISSFYLFKISYVLK